MSKFVRFLCNYAGFKASSDEERIPYKVSDRGRDWVLVRRDGHAYHVPEFITVPCSPARARVRVETWVGN